VITHISPKEAANKVKDLWIKWDGMRLVQEGGEIVSSKINSSACNLAVADCQITTCRYSSKRNWAVANGPIVNDK